MKQAVWEKVKNQQPFSIWLQDQLTFVGTGIVSYL